MICLQIVKKLFYMLSDFEHEENLLLQFYVSSMVQRNGNSDTLCDCTHNFAAAAGLWFLFGAATLLFHIFI